MALLHIYAATVLAHARGTCGCTEYLGVQDKGPPALQGIAEFELRYVGCVAWIDKREGQQEKAKTKN